MEIVQLHAVFSSALDEGDGSAQASVRFPPEKAAPRDPRNAKILYISCNERYIDTHQ
jgi:hypothetical protein